MQNRRKDSGCFALDPSGTSGTDKALLPASERNGGGIEGPRSTSELLFPGGGYNSTSGGGVCRPYSCEEVGIAVAIELQQSRV